MNAHEEISAPLLRNGSKWTVVLTSRFVQGHTTRRGTDGAALSALSALSSERAASTRRFPCIWVSVLNLVSTKVTLGSAGGGEGRCQKPDLSCWSRFQPCSTAQPKHETAEGRERPPKFSVSCCLILRIDLLSD